MNAARIFLPQVPETAQGLESIQRQRTPRMARTLRSTHSHTSIQ
jgi:hypothetical protein